MVKTTQSLQHLKQFDVAVFFWVTVRIKNVVKDSTISFVGPEYTIQEYVIGVALDGLFAQDEKPPY